MAKESEYGTWGRYTEIPVEQMTPEQKKAFDLVTATRGDVPGPYKIWLENPDLITVMVPVGKYFQMSHSSLSDAEREIVVNLINGKWLTHYSNHEHEMIGEKAGLPQANVDALIAGLTTFFEDDRQQVIYEMVSTLIAPRVVPQGLYERAIKLLGNRGLTDVTVLIGYFTSVSLTLSAYDVPSTAVGMKR